MCLLQPTQLIAYMYGAAAMRSDQQELSDKMTAMLKSYYFGLQMHCIKIVYINTMTIFVINKYSIKGEGWGGVARGRRSLVLSVNFCFPALD